MVCDRSKDGRSVSCGVLLGRVKGERDDDDDGDRKRERESSQRLLGRIFLRCWMPSVFALVVVRAKKILGRFEER